MLYNQFLAFCDIPSDFSEALWRKAHAQFIRDAHSLIQPRLNRGLVEASVGIESDWQTIICAP